MLRGVDPEISETDEFPNAVAKSRPRSTKISFPYGVTRLPWFAGQDCDVTNVRVDRTIAFATDFTSPPTTGISVPIGLVPVWNVSHTRARKTAFWLPRRTFRNRVLTFLTASP